MPTLCAAAVLFDLDGTLVDSTAAIEASYRAAAEDLGVPFAAFGPHLHGVPTAQVLATVAPYLPEAERDRMVALILEKQTDPALPVTALPGAVPLLQSLPPDRWAIVTSGSARLVRINLAKAGIPGPRVLVTSDDVSLPKPAPEPFMTAARRLGVPIERCLVVEDSVAGLTSGLAAGAQVLAVTTTHSAGQLAGATWTISSLYDVAVAPGPQDVRLVLS